MTEYIDIIDENDNVVRVASKDDVYKSKLPHRIVHIFVLHPESREIYLQVRAPDKEYLPNYYCTSAAGHVQSGESYEQAAVRELEEEIGIKATLTHITTFPYVHIGIPIQIALFSCEAKEGFNFTDGEVADGRFLPLDEAKSLIAKDELIHPQLTACFLKFLENK